MTSPCNNCPFLREGGIRLASRRRQEIARSLRGGAMFPCHKTTTAGGAKRGHERWCGGALATMDNADGGDPGCMANQMARICSRIGRLNPHEVAGHALCFGSLSDWVKNAPDYDRPAPAPATTET